MKLKNITDREYLLVIHKSSSRSKEAKELAEEALKYGYIDYDKHGVLSIYYKDHRFYPAIASGPTVALGYNGRIGNVVLMKSKDGPHEIESKSLCRELEKMIDTWKVI